MMMGNTNNIEKYNIWDYIFIVWFVTDAAFSHTPISMIGQILFYTYSLLRCVNGHLCKSSFTFLLYALFVFFCWHNIETGNAISESTAKTMLVVVARNFIFLFFAYQYLLKTDLNKLRNLFFISCICASAIILVITYVATGSFVMRDVEGAINGNLQAVNNAIIIGWMYCTRERKIRGISIILMSFLFLFCVLAGTRKAIIVLAIIVMLYTMIKKPASILKNGLKLAVITGILLFLLLKVDFIYDIIGNRFEGILGFVNDTDDVDASTKTRGLFIELGFTYFLLKPFEGYGIDCFREIPGAYETYSHNNYIELLFGIGIWGTISYYLMYLVSLLKGLKRYLSSKRNNYVVLGIALVLACLFADYGMVSYFDRVTYLKILICYFMLSNDLEENYRNCPKKSTMPNLDSAYHSYLAK